MEGTQKSNLIAKILISLGLIALIEIVGFATLHFVSQKQEGLGVLINLSGRQRMLSQRITLIVHEFNNMDLLSSDIEASAKLNKELRDQLNLFMTSHQELVEEAIQRGKNKEPLSLHYTQEGGLNDLVKRFNQEVEGFLSGTYKQSYLATFSQFTKYGLLKNLDVAVKLFEKKNSELNDLFYKAELILLILNIIVLLFVFTFLLYPMAKTVIAREAELEGARDLAQEESRFKSMFLANMSHELRTPLNGVLGTTDLMMSTQLDAEQREYLKIINQSGSTLLSVVNNILDLTKLEVGAVELESIPFDPKDFFASIPKSFQYPVLSKGIAVKVEADNLPKVLWGDTTRLTQILNNILSNAIKFTDEGHVTLSASYIGETLHLKISDTGIGMTEQQLDKVWESFEQADKSTTRKYGGTGLGLSIVKEILDLMKAKYQVESQVGQGTTFSFEIPMKEGKEADLPKRPSSQEEETYEAKEATQEAGLVLVVDDNEINRSLMVKILERMKISPLTADSGQKAIDTLKENSQIDLVFMDYHMPGLNGIEATEIIMKEVQNPPPIIALTADIMPETQKECLDVGMKELLPKPIQRSELKRVLKKYLNKDS